MKIWNKYNRYLSKGEWHIHTNYTDGKNTVFEYCEKAIDMEIPLLAFTEHIRENLTYNFEDFLNDVDKAREQFDLIILSGCEAKVLPNGELDVEKELLKDLDYPIFAFHSFLEDTDLYIECLMTVLKNKYVCAWAHPGLFLLKHNLKISQEQMIDIFKLMHRHEVLLEMNKKYKAPPDCWANVANEFGINIVNGSDAHCIGDLEVRRGSIF